MPSRAEVAAMIDHTLLKPEASGAQLKELVADAVRLGTYSVCVSPNQVPLEVPAGLKLAVVCGFPSGAHTPAVKASEAKESVSYQVDEVDMVMNLSWAKDGRWSDVEADILAVRTAMGRDRMLKVIIESAALSDTEIINACKCAQSAGADFVKTSTGFHPAGGASVQAVALMRATVADSMGVKASGGIRSGADALAMINAGASRLGVSGTEALLASLPA